VDEEISKKDGDGPGTQSGNQIPRANVSKQALPWNLQGPKRKLRTSTTKQQAPRTWRRHQPIGWHWTIG